MESTAGLHDNSASQPTSADSSASLDAQLAVIERTATAAHVAIDNFAKKADVTLRRVRNMASRASSRFDQSCKSYSAWEDECVENSRERIRGRPLSAVFVGLIIGLLVGRVTRS